MITISLCMIVKNEEEVLFRCLNSIKDIADEIIIVDTGSNDNTINIAKSFTDKVYDFPWIDDFSAARNFSYSLASMDYILWLDADDVILESDKNTFLALKQNLSNETDVVMMKYNVGFDENGKVNFSYFRERLSKRQKNFLWKEPVHEYLEIGGNIVSSEIAITHKKNKPSSAGRNLNIYKNLIRQGIPLSPRGMFYYARELFEDGNYAEAIIYFSDFLNTSKGWREDNIRACNDMAVCYKIIGDTVKMLQSLIKSFEYDTPRAEICCRLGDYYFELNEFNKAIVWYKIASELSVPEDSWGFILHDYYGYIPYLQLCVCYDKLGNTEEAIKYNNKAEKLKPKDPAVLYNKKYFKNRQ